MATANRFWNKNREPKENLKIRGRRHAVKEKESDKRRQIEKMNNAIDE